MGGYDSNSTTSSGSTADLITLPNVTALRADIGAAGFARALRGSTSVGDGGEGLFVWDPGSVTDNGGTAFNSTGFGTTKSGGWRRVVDGPLDVLWFQDGVINAGQMINRAIKSLPADGGAIDARQLDGTQQITADIFAGMTTDQPGQLFFGQTIFEINATQNIPSHWIIEGMYGGRTLPGVASDADAGTVFRWTGAINTPIFNLNPVRYSQLRNFTIDGNLKAGSTGILLDSPALNDATHNITIENFSVYDCAIGIRIGSDTPPSVNNAFEIDKFIISEFHIGSDISGSTGIVIASGNAGSDSIIQNGAIQLCKFGVDIVNSAYLKIRHVSCGSLGLTTTPAINPIAFRVITGSPIILEQCQSESGNTGILFLSAPSNTYGSSIAPLMLLDCIINEPIVITHPITIVSIGNYAPSGATATATIADAGTNLTSINDTFANGQGWTFSGTNNQIKKITGKGFVGISGLPGTLPTSAPFRINVDSVIELVAGVDAGNNRPWIQGQNSNTASTYYGTCISPMGGGVSIGAAGSATAGNIAFANSINNPFVKHDALTNDVAPTNLQIRAQDAVGPTNVNGGALVLASGELAGAGQAGAVLIHAGAQSLARFQGFAASNVFAFEPSRSPIITVDQNSGDVAAKTLTVSGQDATAASTGANQNSGGIEFRSGTPNGSGLKGPLRLQFFNADTGVEWVEIAATRRVLSLCKLSTLTTTQMPVNTGDAVIYLANKQTAPTADPVSGGIIYEDAGALMHRGTSGTVTTVAPA